MSDSNYFNDLNEMTEAEMENNGVTSVTDALEGTAEENKKVFDRLPMAIGSLLNLVIEKIKKYASYVELKFNEYLPLTSSGNKEVNIAGDLTLKATGNISIEATEPSSDYHAVNKGYLENRLPKNLSDFTNDTEYVTKGQLDKALDYGLLEIKGDATNPKISAVSKDNSTSTSLDIDFYQLNLQGSYIFGTNIHLCGFICTTPNNDLDLANKFYVDSKKLSQFTNDAGFITSASVPKKLSQFTNDAGFITSDDVPKNLSEYENNAGFVDKQYVDGAVNEILNGFASALAEVVEYQEGLLGE